MTPLIKAGKIKEAQHAAKVELLGQDVTSYSGYFTVGQESCGSNLFFWFFPAMVNSMILFFNILKLIYLVRILRNEVYYGHDFN